MMYIYVRILHFFVSPSGYHRVTQLKGHIDVVCVYIFESFKLHSYATTTDCSVERASMYLIVRIFKMILGFPRSC